MKMKMNLIFDIKRDKADFNMVQQHPRRNSWTEKGKR